MPEAGAGISTVALSVITSTTGSSSFTEAPSATIQRTISPSCTPSPMSGNLNSKEAEEASIEGAGGATGTGATGSAEFSDEDSSRTKMTSPTFATSPSA